LVFALSCCNNVCMGSSKFDNHYSYMGSSKLLFITCVTCVIICSSYG
jgi:hypothetical protein